jgi:acyl-CoA thioesterase II
MSEVLEDHTIEAELSSAMGFSFSGGETILFGGAVMGVALEAMNRVMSKRQGSAHPCTVTCTFVSAASPGKVTVQVEVVKEGRNFAHVSAKLLQNTKTILLLTAIYGAPVANETIVLDGFDQPVLPLVRATPKDDLPAVEALKRLGCNLLDIRIGDGHAEQIMQRIAAPKEKERLSSSSTVDPFPTSVWCSLADDTDMTYSALPLLADYPVMDFIGFLRSQEDEIWDATISLTIHFHRELPLARSKWVQLRVSTPLLTSARHEMSVQMWAEDGGLIATSTQLQTLKVIRVASREDDGRSRL